jgi:hypothetical protein
LRYVTLADAQLVEEETSTDVSRKKLSMVIESGRIAFQFFSDPATSMLVRSILEKVRTHPADFFHQDPVKILQSR